MKVALMAAAVLLAAPLTGCGAVSTTCSDFNKADSSKQQELADGWLENNQDELQGNRLFSLKSSDEQQQYVIDAMTEYCSENPDKDLSELGPGYAFGT